jgi:hypothetical protein
MADYTEGHTGYGILVTSIVEHFHMSEGRVVTFPSESLAKDALGDVQRHYYPKCEVRLLNPKDKIRRSGVIVSRE